MWCHMATMALRVKMAIFSVFLGVGAYKKGHLSTITTFLEKHCGLQYIYIILSPYQKTSSLTLSVAWATLGNLV